jgi:hypothetical protein
MDDRDPRWPSGEAGSMEKIVEYIIENFRGFVDQVTVNLVKTVNQPPVSMIIYGDNGSGKSSLADALEFAFRGRLSRRIAEGSKIKREVKNLASLGAPGVLVKLTGGKNIKRGGGLSASGVPEYRRNQIVEGFEFCPLVVRRQDIESFWRIPEGERQMFFFDYLDSRHAAQQREDEAKLRENLEAAIEEHSKAADYLASMTRFSRSQLPSTHRRTSAFLSGNLIPTYGVDGRLPDKLYKSFLVFQTTLEKKEQLRSAVSALPTQIPIMDRELTRILQNLTSRVTSDFTEITGIEWVEEVTVTAGTGAELAIEVRLANGSKVDPSQILSEASLDLLALLILVEVHIECATLGQNQIIVLDDVFQSVDSVNRIRALNHVLSRLKTWQVIITLHDRLWLELTRKAMGRVGHQFIDQEILAGDFGESPRLREAPGRSAEDLLVYIERRESSSTMTGCAGKVLEELCDGLSIALSANISRTVGDRYTLGHLWNGVGRALKKHGDSIIKQAATNVGLFIDLRNIIGAHYNEWAETLSSKEAVDFANAALDLWRACRCPDCGALFSRLSAPDGKSSIYAWPCGFARQPDETESAEMDKVT